MIISTTDLNKNGQTKEEIVEAFCDNLMSKINKANANGIRKICFDASVYLYKPTNKVFGVLPDNWLEVRKDWTVMPRGYCFSDYEDEIRDKFKRAGYKIKPTGYIGGVWQLTEDIMW